MFSFKKMFLSKKKQQKKKHFINSLGHSEEIFGLDQYIQVTVKGF